MKKSEINKEANKLRSAERVKWLEKAYVLIRQEMIPEAPAEITLVAGFSTAGIGDGMIAGACCPGFMELGEDQREDLITIAFINFKGEDFEWGAQVQVLHVLMHEMLHAAGIHNHLKEFSQRAAKIGLVKPWKATTPSNPLIKELMNMAKILGPLPAGYGDLMPDRKKKQTTRMRKYTCLCIKPRIIRTAADDLRATCHDCDCEFTMEEKE